MKCRNCGHGLIRRWNTFFHSRFRMNICSTNPNVCTCTNPEPELKIVDLGLLGKDRKMTIKEKEKLEECRKLFKENKLTIEEGHKIMDVLMIEEDKRLNFHRNLEPKEVILNAN